MAEITAKVEYDKVKITIGGVLHVQFVRSKFLGLQSWERRPEGKWVIEYTLDGGVMTTDYDTEEKFRNVLNQLERVL